MSVKLAKYYFRQKSPDFVIWKGRLQSLTDTNPAHAFLFYPPCHGQIIYWQVWCYANSSIKWTSAWNHWQIRREPFYPMSCQVCMYGIQDNAFCIVRYFQNQINCWCRNTAFILLASVTEKFSENLHIVANEPSLAFYRIQEHVRKSMPQLVEQRVSIFFSGYFLSNPLHAVWAQANMVEVSLGLEIIWRLVQKDVSRIRSHKKNGHCGVGGFSKSLCTCTCTSLKALFHEGNTMRKIMGNKP
jgi:hypothetical protein